MTEANPGRGGDSGGVARGLFHRPRLGLHARADRRGEPCQRKDGPARDRRTLDEQRLDSPERYVYLQVARLTKALRLGRLPHRRGRPHRRSAAGDARRRARPLSRASRFPARGRPAARLSSASAAAYEDFIFVNIFPSAAFTGACLGSGSQGSEARPRVANHRLVPKSEARPRVSKHAGEGGAGSRPSSPPRGKRPARGTSG